MQEKAFPFFMHEGPTGRSRPNGMAPHALPRIFSLLKRQKVFVYRDFYVLLPMETT